MFDLADESLTKLKKNSPVDRLDTDPPPDDEPAAHPLETEDKQQLHRQLLAYYRLEIDRQAPNRAEQAEDEAYYDSEQWTEAEAQALRDRGQEPIVWNVIATSVDWVLGSEKRGRTDFKILPRGKEDAKPAEAKTKYLKYLSDVNRTPFHRSRAFADAVKVGVGWMECGFQEEDDGEPIYDRYESWRNIIWDSASTELDGSDMRYQFRSKWVDEDIAKALVKDKRLHHLIEAAVTHSTMYGTVDMLDGDDAMDFAESEREQIGSSTAVITHQRRRLRLIEAWYRLPEAVKRLRGSKSPFNGQIYDDTDPRHVEAVESGFCTVVEKVMMRTRVALMTTTGLLYDGPSPYRHNRFKFIPIWGYRRGKDGLPYGMVRRLKDIQSDINKRMSKAQYILSTNKVIMDEGAVEDMDAFQDEVARPDAIIVKRPGKQLDLNVDRELAPAHLELANRGIQAIQMAGGVTDELLGRTTNAQSGIAIERRQEQGSLATSTFFDNLRLAEQQRGELALSLMEQYVTEEKQFRITNQRGTPEYLTINDGLPENDITRTKADFVIGEQDWRTTMRQAAVDQLMEMMGKIAPADPMLARAVIDLVVEEMDIGNRDEIVKRIRAITGQRDPDATELTPEEQQAMQAAAQAQALQQAQVEAALREQNAKAGKAEAEADRIKADTINTKMTAAGTAMTAATAVIQMPTIAKVADNLLAEAGWSGVQAEQGLPPMPAQQPPVVEAPQPDAPNGMVPMDQPQQ